MFAAPKGIMPAGLKEARGPYDGFLLSLANCFPRELLSVIENLEKGDVQAAGEISGTAQHVAGKDLHHRQAPDSRQRIYQCQQGHGSFPCLRPRCGKPSRSAPPRRGSPPARDSDGHEGSSGKPGFSAGEGVLGIEISAVIL